MNIWTFVFVQKLLFGLYVCVTRDSSFAGCIADSLRGCPHVVVLRLTVPGTVSYCYQVKDRTHADCLFWTFGWLIFQVVSLRGLLERKEIIQLTGRLVVWLLACMHIFVELQRQTEHKGKSYLKNMYALCLMLLYRRQVDGLMTQKSC
jgi:hypothetical protein